MSIKRVMIIAEAGVNHNADLALAKKLVDVAKEAGADVVKFQTAIPELVVSAVGKMANYQKINLGVEESQLEMTRKIHLPLSAFAEIKKYCQIKDIIFASTAFDLQSLAYLDQLDVPFHKVPSGEITNLPYLKAMARCGKPIILSTGMSTLQEIAEALKILQDAKVTKDNITVLHCHTDYPTQMRHVNLRAMRTIADTFDINVGYSDHTNGIEVPIAAVAMGARIIEKHFTVDRGLPGPDHAASLEPDELQEMVRAIRNIEEALGSPQKLPTEPEKKNIPIARRSIHLVRSMTPDSVLAEGDLIMKRPGDGISPMQLSRVLGKRIRAHFPEDHKLAWEDLV